MDPRDNWDRATGRIYRVRPKDYKPARPRDLGAMSSRELVKRLGSPNRWETDTTLRLLGDRKDRNVIPELEKLLVDGDARESLYGLWGLHQVGGLDEVAMAAALKPRDQLPRELGIE